MKEKSMRFHVSPVGQGAAEQNITSTDPDLDVLNMDDFGGENHDVNAGQGDFSAFFANYCKLRPKAARKGHIRVQSGL